jgi:hypothetical protein
MQTETILSIIAGTILGWLFPKFVALAGYLLRLFYRSAPEGIWHVYHVTNKDGEVCIRSHQWKVKKGVAARYIIDDCNTETGKVEYKGQIHLEGSFWLVQLHALGHVEEVSCRLFNPVMLGENPNTHGLFICIDYRNIPIAGPIVISRTEMPLTEVYELLAVKIHINNKTRLISAIPS